MSAEFVVEGGIYVKSVLDYVLSNGKGKGMASLRIRQAIIPCAGYGTRLLPATKCVPKELLPIVNVPAIQYVVEELADAGIVEIVLVCNPHKASIIDHFLSDRCLENFLSERHKQGALSHLEKISSKLKITVVNQSKPKGLGDAVLCAEKQVSDPRFIVVLPDVVFSRKSKSTHHLIEVCQNNSCGGVLLKEFLLQNSRQYGVIKGKRLEEGVYGVEKAIEKPVPDEAPSNLGIIGRYVLDQTAFELLRHARPSQSGEIELTTVISDIAQLQKFLGVMVDEEPLFDIGTIEGYVAATDHFFKSEERSK